MRELRLPHEAGTEGAVEVDTPFHRSVTATIRSLKDCKGVVAIDGPPGNGKTFSSIAAASIATRPVYWLALTGATSLTAMYRELLFEITGEAPDNRSALLLGEEVKELLRAHSCWLFVDEAQWARTELLRVLRSIYDDNPHELFGLVLLGHGLSTVKAREKGLWSRVSCAVKAAEMKPDQVNRYIRQYHPMFNRVAGPDLYKMWRYAGGNFRHWAHFLQKANHLGISDKSKVTSEDVQDIIDLIGKQPIHRQARNGGAVFVPEQEREAS